MDLSTLKTWAQIKTKLPTDKKSRSAELVGLIKHHRNIYYAGKPVLSDKDYDLLEKALQDIDPNNSVLHEVGYTTKVAKEEVKLPYPMASLDKIRPDFGNVEKWLNTHPGPYVVMSKLDGVSLLINNDPEPVALTRGRDGVNGQDITHLLSYMAVPRKLPKKLAVRGEILMPESTFKSKWAGERNEGKYKNSRNMAAGLVNRKSLTPEHKNAVKDLHFIAYAVLNPAMKQSQALAFLKKQGFKVVEYEVVETLTESQLATMLRDFKKRSPYNIDGLVVSQDIVARPTAGNPKHSAAFKDVLESNIAHAKVVKVVWETSRYGLLKPVIIIEPVELSGVTVQRVTGHNAKTIHSGKIGPGAVIKVTRSGEVIPYLMEVVTSAKKPQMPNVEWEWGESGVEAHLVEADDQMEIKRIAYFFSALGVDSIREGVVSKMYFGGLDTIPKILAAKVKDFAAIEGIGTSNSTTFFQNIHSTLMSLYLPTLMVASGTFPRGVSDKTLGKLYEVAGEELLTVTKASVLRSWCEEASLGPVTTESVLKGFPAFKTFFKSISKYVKLTEPEEIEVKSTKLRGIKVAFTGFRDATLTEKILQNGGEVSDSMNSTTNVLLAKDPGSGSSKIQRALDKGIAVITPAEFLKKHRLV